MNRLQSIGTNPVIRNFAKDSSQASVRRVASFLAPTVEVPTLTGKYKVYDAKHRYKRPVTKRAADGSVTRLGFTASDANYNLVPHALDFPIANVETLNDEGLLTRRATARASWRMLPASIMRLRPSKPRWRRWVLAPIKTSRPVAMIPLRISMASS